MQEQILHKLTRVYTVMLLAYPAQFRREYGHEMVVVFRTQVRSALRQGPRWRLVRLLGHVALDWVATAGRERTSDDGLWRACRWLVALPLAMLAGIAALRVVTFTWLSMSPGLAYAWAWTSVALFLMSGAFVAVGVWVSPTRKGEVARIALSVVMAGSTGFVVLGASQAAATPVAWGLAILLGGLVSYLVAARRGRVASKTSP